MTLNRHMRAWWATGGSRPWASMARSTKGATESTTICCAWAEAAQGTRARPRGTGAGLATEANASEGGAKKNPRPPLPPLPLLALPHLWRHGVCQVSEAPQARLRGVGVVHVGLQTDGHQGEDILAGGLARGRESGARGDRGQPLAVTAGRDLDGCKWGGAGCLCAGVCVCISGVGVRAPLRCADVWAEWRARQRPARHGAPETATALATHTFPVCSAGVDSTPRHLRAEAMTRVC